MDLSSTPGSQPLPTAAGESATVSTIGSAPDDATLMLRYRKGDVRAFEMLYERHKGALYRYLQRLCRSPEVANDLFQEVWSKVIASRERYEVRAKFTTFLFHIAHNCAIDHFRRAGRPQEKGAQDVDALADELSGPGHESPDAAVSEAQLRADFKRALDELPAEQRDVFLLYEETGLGLEDIGRITGVAMETAKSRLRYALGKLRGALRQHQSPSLQSSVS
ncbi:RNA polymerase sigma factor [Steroidobacter cummioxidans]|uniref:RNA polymerase sigma factor n=1 Tax=Steroidobacter cummioxidans TaxID=1803913 RepID=UPI0019D4EBDD|nr:RNA polymerase sigma factor [Steroidobacter cummioxidans]